MIARFRIWMGCAYLRLQSVHCLLRLLETYPSSKPPKDPHVRMREIIKGRWSQRSRRPNLNRRWIIESCRHHAHNRIRAPFECDSPAHNLWIGMKCSAPKMIAQERYFRPTRPVFLIRIESPNLGLNSQNTQVIGRYRVADQKLRRTD